MNRDMADSKGGYDRETLWGERAPGWAGPALACLSAGLFSVSASLVMAPETAAAMRPTEVPPPAAPVQGQDTSGATAPTASKVGVRQPSATAEHVGTTPCPPRGRYTFERARTRPTQALPDPALLRVVRHLQQNPEATVVVSGHADASGDPVSNLKLSQRRANVVARHIAALGIAPGRTLVRAFGEYSPQELTHKVNRRVEVRVLNEPPHCHKVVQKGPQ